MAEITDDERAIAITLLQLMDKTGTRPRPGDTSSNERTYTVGALEFYSNHMGLPGYLSTARRWTLASEGWTLHVSAETDVVWTLSGSHKAFDAAMTAVRLTLGI